MTYDWTTDPLMLAAGNARGLPGGDPDAMDGSPTAGRIVGTGTPVSDDEAELFACDDCGEEFSTRRQLESHEYEGCWARRDDDGR